MRRKHPERIKRVHKERTKLVSMKDLLKARWHFFSLFIKIRDNWTCITCGVSLPGDTTTIHAGHLIHGNFFDNNPYIVNAQCGPCNFDMKFHDAIRLRYYNAACKKWGKELIDEYVNLKHPQAKWYRSDVDMEIIKYYNEVVGKVKLQPKYERIAQDLLLKQAEEEKAEDRTNENIHS